MAVRLLTIAIGGFFIIWVLYAPPSSSPTALAGQFLQVFNPRLLIEVVVVLGWVLSALIFAQYWGTVHGITMGILVMTCSQLIRSAIISQRRMRLIEGLGNFCAMLSSQASVAPTVQVAVIESANWIDGPMRPAVLTLAREAEDFGTSVAVRHFAEEVPHPLAESIADVVTAAHHEGVAYARPLELLAEDLADEVEIARVLYRTAGARLPVHALTIALSAAMIILVARLLADVGAWFASPRGEMAALGTAVINWLMTIPIITRINSEMRN